MNGDKVPHILHFDTQLGGQFHTPVTWGSSENPLKRRMDSFRSWSGCVGDEKSPSYDGKQLPHIRIIGLFTDTFVPLCYKIYQVKLNMLERSFCFVIWSTCVLLQQQFHLEHQSKGNYLAEKPLISF